MARESVTLRCEDYDGVMHYMTEQRRPWCQANMPLADWHGNANHTKVVTCLRCLWHAFFRPRKKESP